MYSQGLVEADIGPIDLRATWCLRNSVSNSEGNCAHVSTFQTLVAQKIPKWRIFLCTRNKIQKLFPYELNLFFRKI